MKAAASVTVHKQIDQVFTEFANLDNRSTFIPTIRELKVLSHDWAGRGAEWEESRFSDGIMKKGKFLVTEYKPPRLLVIDIHTMGVTYKVRYNFQPEGDAATKIIASIGGQQKGWLARFMKRFLSDNSDYVHSELQQELDAFRNLLEKA